MPTNNVCPVCGWQLHDSECPIWLMPDPFHICSPSLRKDITEAAFKHVRHDALLEAERVCETVMGAPLPRSPHSPHKQGVRVGAQQCAAAIRKLREGK